MADADHIAIADGGDLLGFARIGLTATTYMDAGAVGVPFAVAAALAFPDRQMILVNCDGAYGINAMEIETAVRHGAKAAFIVSNNAAWNIDRYDQEFNYGGPVVGTTLRHFDYAGMARALISGASSGLGLHFPHILAEAGAEVTLAARRTDAVEAKTLRSAGRAAEAGAIDVTSPDGIAPFFAGRPAFDIFGTTRVSRANRARWTWRWMPPEASSTPT
ncbi:thiamine pyrophosphate-dependent enzyme [Jannaschia seohaensis]|uniref:Thiamine pyrophosphate enzyme, C-terminal TPP binding domain n=1 Tax=Jannaschia seohaensis TaxID=475081 RepID=A0A2Y9AUX2_9RHOB|nr:thiamine pyrophosphate-dependent enzyme [Jannaschia seohaensis]PWJ16942.1 thiamine pyrophosphate-dependent enzyme [Jannaschia seohaensis]SSA48160.1 Thiamine pyrophosphate enzyme, C-terminal TPP binding domain [Jannaschia seohaensis]